jgi:hypothetical protein
MDSGTITAIAALAGSVAGVLSSLGGTWILQRYRGRHDIMQREIARRETLYSDFITEAARGFLTAAGHHLADAKLLVPLYALLNRIRLTASSQVLAAAEAVTKAIVDSYANPNLTPEELHDLTMRGEDPLSDFSVVCRAELEAMRKRFG